MKTKRRLYSLFLYEQDDCIGRYKVEINDMKQLSNTMSDFIIRDGFKKGYNISQQTKMYEEFCKIIHKKYINCEKIKASDFPMFLAVKMALYRFNQTSSEDFLFLKDKKPSLIHLKKKDGVIHNAYVRKRKRKNNSKRKSTNKK